MSTILDTEDLDVTKHTATAIDRIATADPEVTEYVISRSDSPWRDMFVAIEPNAAGGFNIWHTSIGEKHRYSGDVCLMPAYRPDAESARTAAWNLAIEVLRTWSHEYTDAERAKLIIQVCSGDRPLYELSNIQSLYA